MAEGLLLEKNSGSKSLLLEEVYAALPFECASVERSEITGELEFVAPPGKAFQITGEFMLTTDQNNIDLWGPPIYSATSLKKEYPERFARFLEETDGDERTALSLLYKDTTELLYDEDEEVEPTVMFTGRSLVVVIGSRGARITIKGEINSWTEDAFASVELPLSSHGIATESYGFDIPGGALHWQREVAEAEFGTCQVVLVDYKVPETMLEPEIARPREVLWTPARKVTAKEIVEYKAGLLKMNLTEEEKERWRQEVIERDRELRKYGFAAGYGDDPLRNVAIIQGPTAEDIDALVAACKNAASGDVIDKPEDDSPF